MNNIVIKDKLIGAGIGAGVGLTLAYLSGANKIGVTLVFSALGGVIAYSLVEDSFSGASGTAIFLSCASSHFFIRV